MSSTESKTYITVKDEDWVPPEAPPNAFVSLKGLKPQEVQRMMKYLPKDAEKFQHILERERYNPARDPKLDALAAKITTLTNDADVRAAVADVVPADYHKYKQYLDSLPADQLKTAREMYIRLTVPESNEPVVKPFQHTVNREFITKLFQSDAPKVVSEAFAKAPEARRQTWMELSLWHLTQSYAAPVVEKLKKCVMEEKHAASGYPAVDRPCVQYSEGVVSLQKHKEDLLNNQCNREYKDYRHYMVPYPDYKKAGFYFNKLVTCLDTEYVTALGNAASLSRPSQ